MPHDGVLGFNSNTSNNSSDASPVDAHDVSLEAQLGVTQTLPSSAHSNVVRSPSSFPDLIRATAIVNA